MTVQVNLSKYLEQEYEIEHEGQRYRLKPLKAWVLKPRNANRGIVIGLFKLPNGKTVRKAIGKVQVQ